MLEGLRQRFWQLKTLNVKDRLCICREWVDTAALQRYAIGSSMMVNIWLDVSLIINMFKPQEAD
jgi:hypothetical protein